MNIHNLYNAVSLHSCNISNSSTTTTPTTATAPAAANNMRHKPLLYGTGYLELNTHPTHIGPETFCNVDNVVARAVHVA